MLSAPRFDIAGFKTWLANSSGNVAIMSAFVFPVCIGVVAFGVDMGSLHFERRELQAAADSAAIFAAANVGKAEEAARLALQDNGIELAEKGAGGGIQSGEMGTLAKVSVLTGNYRADKTTASGSRFVASASPRNAAMVTVTQRGSLFFASSFSEPPVLQVSAVALSSARAAFSVGSRLASVNGGVVNQILGGLTGSTLSLSVMDYEALVDADVSVLGLLDALAVDLHLTAATYDEVLNSEVSVGQLAAAMASQAPDSASASALRALERATHASGLEIPMSKLFKLGDLGHYDVGTGQAALDARVSAFSLIGAAIAVADGKHQVSSNLGASIPGLASATVELAIGEPPRNSTWFAVGDSGSVVRTAQTRLRVTVQALGSGALAGASIRLPVYLELASATAELAAASCPSGQPSSATADVKVTPAVFEAWIGEIVAHDFDDFDKSPIVQKGSLLNVPLIKATGYAHAAMTNLNPKTLTFTASDISSRKKQTVATEDFTGSLIKTLLGDLDLNLHVLGFGITSPAAAESALVTTLSQAAPAVDSLLANTLNTLGISIGEADVWVNGVQCQRAVLVQ